MLKITNQKSKQFVPAMIVVTPPPRKRTITATTIATTVATIFKKSSHPIHHQIHLKINHKINQLENGKKEQP